MERGRFVESMLEGSEGRAWLESTKTRGMALGLEHTFETLKELRLQPLTGELVHVAGSNGKGTTVASLCAALTASGVTNLSFTSPHLVRVEERIRINGRPVSAADFDDALKVVKAADEARNNALTFFETTFLIAMVIAARSQVRVVVLETGLGGRLDATRVASADLCIVTSLSLEHTDVLGATLREIAAEKAAIARPGVPMVVRRPAEADVVEVIESCAANAGERLLSEGTGPASLHWVNIEPGWSYHQEAMAVAAEAWTHLKACKSLAFPDLRAVTWPGRMHELCSPRREDLCFLLDGAHNPSGMEASCAVLETFLAQRTSWSLMVGTSPQNQMQTMLAPLVSLCLRHPPTEVVVSVPQGGRYPGVPGEVLKKHLHDAGLEVTHVSATPEEAVMWFETASEVETVVSIGSLYMQGNVMEVLGAVDDRALSIEAKQ